MKAIIMMLVLIGLSNFRPDTTIYQFTVTDINGEEINLSAFENKVVLIVNVASKCGLTPQYEELQSLFTQRESEGLVILGFPANNFAGQEPGTDDEIAQFCEKNYGVTFPMFSKISVKGDDIHPLYQFLTQKSMNEVADSKVKWNFQKYLIGKDGKLREVIEPKKSVMDADVIAQIDGLLAE